MIQRERGGKYFVKTIFPTKQLTTHHSISLAACTSLGNMTETIPQRFECTCLRQRLIAARRRCCGTCNLYCIPSPRCKARESYWLRLEWVLISPAMALGRPDLVPLLHPPIVWSNSSNHPRMESPTLSIWQPAW